MIALRRRWPAWPLVMLPAAVALGAAAGASPKYALAGAFALAFVALVLIDFSWGVATFAFLTFLDLSAGISAPVGLTKVAGLLILLVWLAQVSTREGGAGRFAREHPGLLAVLLAFLAWTAASMVWAPVPGAAATALYRYGPNFSLFLVVYTAVDDRRTLLRYLGAFVAGAAAATLYGLLVPPGSAPTSTLNDTSRLTGTIGDPNELAATLVAALPLAGALAAMPSLSPPKRLAAAGGGVLCLVGVLLSLSRGGLVALAVSLVAAIVIGGRWRVKATVLALLVVGAALVYFGALASPAARDRVLHPGTGAGRSDIWRVGWRMVERYPLTGVGAGNFPTSSVHYLLRPGLIRRSIYIVDLPKVAHNTYLGVLAEQGIIGAGMFLAILITAVACGVRARRLFARTGRRELELLAYAFLVGLTGMLGAVFFFTAEYNKQLWILLALGPALWALARRSAPAVSPRA
jgi:O-antigen ligase